MHFTLWRASLLNGLYAMCGACLGIMTVAYLRGDFVLPDSDRPDPDTPVYVCHHVPGGAVSCSAQERSYGEFSRWSHEEFTQLQVLGWIPTCIEEARERRTCYGHDGLPRTVSRLEGYARVVAGSERTCAIREDGRATCWGGSRRAPAPWIPDEAFSKIAFHSERFCGDVPCRVRFCGIRPEGEVVCWRDDATMEEDGPEGRFVEVGVRSDHACALGENSRITCWGDATPFVPEGEFDQVSFAQRRACGVRTDGTLRCWRESGLERITPTSGGFTQVSAGDWHSCALHESGRVECWGSDVRGKSSPPPGHFAQVSVGRGHSCAISRHGRITCWGANNFGQASPPDRLFEEVSAGSQHTCARDLRGLITCWGRNASGESALADPSQAEAR